MAEKIRSLFQRTRPRDLYDIWRLDDHVNRRKVKSILLEKCQYKGVILDINKLNHNRESFASTWNVSLRHQMKDVPDFKDVFEKILECIQYWNTP